MTETEREIRLTLWINHGHFGCLYGDDGEMQCQLCPADYLRDPIVELIKKALGARVNYEERKL